MTDSKCQKAIDAFVSIVTDWRSWTPFCHGTPLRSAEQILKDGAIIPRECGERGCRPSNYEGAIASNKYLVYLGSRSMPFCYDSAASTFLLPRDRPREKGMVFHVNLIEDSGRLEPDEDYLKDGLWKRTMEKIPIIHETVHRNEDEWNAEVDPYLRIGTAGIGYEEHQDKLIDMLKECPLDKVRNTYTNLPEWAKSLISMRAVGYRGKIEIDESNAERL